MKRPLPTIKTPEYSITLPLSQKRISYRPYNVADERLLLEAATAKDSDSQFYVDNTLQVIRGAITSTDISVDSIPAIDVRFLLLHQRAKSVGEIIEFKYDNEVVSVDISKFVLVNPHSKDDYKIDIGGGIGLQMKDISFADEVESSRNTSDDNKVAVFYNMIIKSIHSIFTNDDVWVVGQDIDVADVEEFIKPIPTTESKKLYDFIANGPYIAVKTEIKGKEVELTSREIDFLS